MDSPSPASGLLRAWGEGDLQARDRLLPLVYRELRQRARGYLRRERPDHTLQPTALVHEAYLNLAGQDRIVWKNRAQFFGVAAQMMRRILVDHARTKRAQKRGGGQPRADLDPDGLPASGFDSDRWLDLDEALTRFAAIDAAAAELAKLRIFGGLSVAEAGEALAMPRATAFRTWTYARAWLTARLADAATKIPEDR